MFETRRKGSVVEVGIVGSATQKKQVRVESVASFMKAANQTLFRLRDLIILAMVSAPILLVMGIVAIVIKFNDPQAPVFFMQTRYGLHGRPFRIVKFRTMIPGAESLKVDLLELSVDKGAGFKLDNDPRVTRPGRWLRKRYLDELPQFWNVFRGDMTLVGPRANSYKPETYESWQMERLVVPPGITGSWQVMNPKPQEFDKRCLIDIDYVRNRSFMGDLLILARTFYVSLFRRSGC